MLPPRIVVRRPEEGTLGRAMASVKTWLKTEKRCPLAGSERKKTLDVDAFLALHRTAKRALEAGARWWSAWRRANGRFGAGRPRRARHFRHADPAALSGGRSILRFLSAAHGSRRVSRASGRSTRNLYG